MKENKLNIFLQNKLIKILHFFAAASMLAVSIYMSYHYYDIYFPTSYSVSSFCDISSYFNCDVATLSPLSSVLGVPIAVMGAFLLL